MEKTRVQKYAESLERVIQNDHRYLKETMDDFQEKCMLVTAISRVPPKVLIDIRQGYREIQDRLREIRAVQQLLKAKYFLYTRKDPRRERDLTELGLAAKACYSKFEHGVRQIEKKELQEKGKILGADRELLSFQWFNNEENQVMFLRNWRILNELDYEISASRVEEKREVVQDRPRSLTLFVFKGEAKFIESFQSRMQLREHDVIERRNGDELRGLLTHLREIPPPEVEKIFHRFKESEGFSKIKGLLIPIRSQEDQDKNIVALMEKALQEMAEGDLKTLSV
jgi:hypothetical protein